MPTEGTNNSGTTQNAGAGDGTTKDDKKRFEFDPEEQKFIEGLIDKAVGRAHSQYRTEIETLQNKLKEFEAGQGKSGNTDDKDGGDKGKKKDDGDTAQFKELLRKEQDRVKDQETLRKQAEDKAKNAEAELMRTRKEVAISKAASKQDFYELDVVMKMTDHLIQWDEDLKVWVVTENGTVKKNAAMEPMSLEEFYADFASKRQYLVKGSVLGGAGSTEGGVGNTGTVLAKSDLKTPKQKSDYITKYGLEAWEHLPAVRKEAK